MTKYPYTCNRCGQLVFLSTDAINPNTWLCKKCRKLEEEEQESMDGFPGGVIDSQDLKGRGE